jgi:hypothetical protein
MQKKLIKPRHYLKDKIIFKNKIRVRRECPQSDKGKLGKTYS